MEPVCPKRPYPVRPDRSRKAEERSVFACARSDLASGSNREAGRGCSMTLEPIGNGISRPGVKKRVRSEDRFRSARRREERRARKFVKEQLVFDWYSSTDRRDAA